MRGVLVVTVNHGFPSRQVQDAAALGDTLGESGPHRLEWRDEPNAISVGTAHHGRGSRIPDAIGSSGRVFGIAVDDWRSIAKIAEVAKRARCRTVSSVRWAGNAKILGVGE